MRAVCLGAEPLPQRQPQADLDGKDRRPPSRGDCEHCTARRHHGVLECRHSAAAPARQPVQQEPQPRLCRQAQQPHEHPGTLQHEARRVHRRRRLLPLPHPRWLPLPRPRTRVCHALRPLRDAARRPLDAGPARGAAQGAQPRSFPAQLQRHRRHRGSDRQLAHRRRQHPHGRAGRRARLSQVHQRLRLRRVLRERPPRIYFVLQTHRHACSRVPETPARRARLRRRGHARGVPATLPDRQASRPNRASSSSARAFPWTSCSATARTIPAGSQRCSTCYPAAYT